MLKGFIIAQIVLLFSFLGWSSNFSDDDIVTEGLLTILEGNPDDLMPVYKKLSQAEPRSSRQIARHPTPPQPPHLVAHSNAQTDELIKLAKGGDAQKLNELVKRIYWSASENPFFLSEVLDIKDINKKAMSSQGHFYWNIIFLCKGFDHFPGLLDKIKKLAEEPYYYATAQNIYGLIQSQESSFMHIQGNWEEAIKYWKQATQQNFAPALVNLGKYFESGVYSSGL